MKNVIQHVLLGLLISLLGGIAYLCALLFDPLGRLLFVGWLVQAVFWIGHESADYARTIRSQPNEWRHWWEIFDVRRWSPGQQWDAGAPIVIIGALFITFWLAWRSL